MATGILDNYNLRFNYGTNQLEMNTGAETWVTIPGTVPTSGNITVGTLTSSEIRNSGVAVLPFIIGTTFASQGAPIIFAMHDSDAFGLTFADATGSTAFMTLDTLNQRLDLKNHPVVNVAGLAMTGTTTTFQPPKLTDTQMNALTAVEGMVIYNTTQHAVAFYNGSVWKITATV